MSQFMAKRSNLHIMQQVTDGPALARRGDSVAPCQFLFNSDSMESPSDSEVIFRPFNRENDYKQMLEIFATGMREQWIGEDVDIQQYIDESIADDLDNLEKVYLSRDVSPKGNFWIASRPNDPEVLGMVGLQYLNDKECELRRMSVSPKARRMKVGSRLLLQLLSFAKEQGYEKVLLSTGSIMHAGRKLYEKHGFQKTKEELVAPNVLITFYEKIL